MREVQEDEGPASAEDDVEGGTASKAVGQKKTRKQMNGALKNKAVKNMYSSSGLLLIIILLMTLSDPNISNNQSVI